MRLTVTKGGRRGAAAGTVLAIAVLSLGSGMAVETAQAATATQGETKRGTGDVAGFSATVAKTSDLINENVLVSWEWPDHATPQANYGRDFVTVMQCGGDANGAVRERCQYGAYTNSSVLVNPEQNPIVQTRQVVPSADRPTTEAAAIEAAKANQGVWDDLEIRQGGYPRKPVRSLSVVVGADAGPGAVEGFNAYENDDPATAADESLRQRAVSWELLPVVGGVVSQQQLAGGQSVGFVQRSQSAADKASGCGAEVLLTGAQGVSARENCRGTATINLVVDVPSTPPPGSFVLRYSGRVGDRTVTEDLPVRVVAASTAGVTCNGDGTSPASCVPPACTPGQPLFPVGDVDRTCTTAGTYIELPRGPSPTQPAGPGAPPRFVDATPSVADVPGAVSLVDAAGKTIELPADPTALQFATTDVAFGQQTSNEVPFGRINSDERGQVLFEVQTGRESPFLGCGVDEPDCYLVVVPRGDTEVDGRTVTGSGDKSQLLHASSLSLSNWQNRLEFRLGFRDLVGTCPLDLDEATVQGNEAMVRAVSSWKLPLCDDVDVNFAYVPQRDAVLDGAVSRGGGLYLTGSPSLDPATQVVAPVGVTSLVIAFNVERVQRACAGNQSPGPLCDSAPVADLNGSRVTDLVLTPRLIAKLLTESYQGSVARYDERLSPEAAHLKENPTSLFSDPEFYEANRDILGLGGPPSGESFRNNPEDAPGELMTIDGESEWLGALWDYVRADPKARAFLDGETDPADGMTINPKYQDIQFPRRDTPRLENACWFWNNPSEGNPQTFIPLCFDDRWPSLSTFTDGALRTSRATPPGTVGWALNGEVRSPVRAPRQRPGERAMFTLTTAAEAARFGLATMRLPNADGLVVGATTQTMSAAAAQADPAAPVPQVDAGRVTGAGYPLTRIMYATTRPTELTEAQCAEFADFLDFAATSGQTPGNGVGQLPPGYAPLSDSQRSQLATAADRVAACPRPAVAPSTPPASTTSSSSSSSSSSSTPSGTTSTTTVRPTTTARPTAPAVASQPTAAAAPPAPEATPSVEPSDGAGVLTARSATTTPSTQIGGLRYLVPVVLAVGIASLAAGPIVTRLSPKPGG